MKKDLKRLLILILSGSMTLGEMLTASAQDSVGITYSKEYTTDGQIKTFETPDGFVFQGAVSELPDKNFTITINPKENREESELNYTIENVWIGKSTDGMVWPVTRHPFADGGNETELQKIGEHTYNLEGLNIEEYEEYGFFIDVKLKDSSETKVGDNTFAAFFRINPSLGSQSIADGNNRTGDGNSSVTYFWQNNETGWWVRCSDGTYLVSQWYCSPESNLWYYLGEDGYMLTDTVTPDGYSVDADGVWIQ